MGRARLEGSRAGAGGDRPKDIEQVLRDSSEASRLSPASRKGVFSPDLSFPTLSVSAGTWPWTGVPCACCLYLNSSSSAEIPKAPSLPTSLPLHGANVDSPFWSHENVEVSGLTQDF